MIRTGFALGLLLAVAHGSWAGQEKGNGGDGVMDLQGRVFLFDFFETSYAQFQRYEPPVLEEERVWAIENFVRSLGEGENPPFLNLGSKNGAESQRALSAALSVLSDTYPQLTLELIEELKGFLWNRSPYTLSPSSDTMTVFDPEVFSRWIGCALNVRGRISYSPECGSEAMDGPNHAGLLMHEALFSRLRKLHPETQSSELVRFLNSIIFSADAREVLPIYNSDFAYFSEMPAHVINDAFYGGLGPYQTIRMDLDCELAGQEVGLTGISLKFRGAMRVSGTLISSSTLERVEGTLAGDEPPSSRAWHPSLPYYDFTRRRMSLDLVHSVSGEQIPLQIDMSQKARIRIHLTRNGQSIGGECRRNSSSYGEDSEKK